MGKHGHQCRQRSAQGYARVHDADGGAAPLFADRLGAQGDQVGQGGAQAQAGHQTCQEQLRVAVDIGGPERKQAKQDDRRHQYLLASDAVGQPATKERARQQADNAGAEYPAKHLRVQGKALAQSRRRRAG
ncbi:hypothetical protein D3C72_1604880 [compost metagenome]